MSQSVNPDRVRQIAQQANAITDPQRQAEFLREACGDDLMLFVEVEDLLHTLQIGTDELADDPPPPQADGIPLDCATSQP